MFRALEKIYDDCIEKLSRDREAIITWELNYGFSSEEFRFMELLKRNRPDLIKGPLVRNVLRSINSDGFKRENHLKIPSLSAVETIWKK